MRDQTSTIHGVVESIDLSGFDKDTAASVASGMSVAEMAAWLKELRELNEAADRLKKTVGAVYDHMRTVTIPERMDEEGLSSMRVEGVGMVKLTSDLYTSVKDKDSLYRWLEEHGLDHLIQEQVNAQQLKSVLRKRLESGEEVPQDLVKMTPFTRASITK